MITLVKIVVLLVSFELSSRSNLDWTRCMVLPWKTCKKIAKKPTCPLVKDSSQSLLDILNWRPNSAATIRCNIFSTLGDPVLRIVVRNLWRNGYAYATWGAAALALVA